MVERIPIDAQCPATTCGSDDVELVYEKLKKVGSTEVHGIAPRGGECQDCGLQFLDDDVREICKTASREGVDAVKSVEPDD